MANAEQDNLSGFLAARLTALGIIRDKAKVDPERHVQNVQTYMDLTARAAELRAIGDSDNARKMQELAEGYKTL